MIDSDLVSVIMPAYRAQRTIGASIVSVLAQTHGNFEILLVGDDEADYPDLLARQGIHDPRIRFLHTGRTGTGSSSARNVGLEAAQGRYCALLDADDRFEPEKLAVMLEGTRSHGMASCALALVTYEGAVRRHVGLGPDGPLTAHAYKFTNFSMDSMLVYDRKRADPRYDPALTCLTDLDFVLKLFCALPQCFHFGSPLHQYVKLPVSISNGAGVTERMVATKQMLLKRLRSGRYPLADPLAGAGFERFLEISLGAERSFAPDPTAPDPLLFESHLEPLLDR